MIEQNYQKIMECIDTTCQQCRRTLDEITLIAVSKKQPIEAIQAAYDLGIRDFGENYLQELLSKKEQLPDDIRWHFIGDVQSKKIKQIPKDISMVHSLDRDSQIKAWKKEKDQDRKMIPSLIQLNVAAEQSKSGISTDQIEAFCEKVLDFPIRGLMTFPPYGNDEKTLRSYFAQCREMLEKLPQHFGRELSMGVSSDYPWAIMEGATMIRIGSALFGART